jgi:hypothetical protein
MKRIDRVCYQPATSFSPVMRRQPGPARVGLGFVQKQIDHFQQNDQFVFEQSVSE